MVDFKFLLLGHCRQFRVITSTCIKSKGKRNIVVHVCYGHVVRPVKREKEIIHLSLIKKKKNYCELFSF